jgi:hypothetical protein
LFGDTKFFKTVFATGGDLEKELSDLRKLEIEKFKK